MSTDKVSPLVKDALKQVSGLLPVKPDDRLRFEFVVRGDGEIQVSMPPPQLEAEFWKAYIYFQDIAKHHYSVKRSPLAI